MTTTPRLWNSPTQVNTTDGSTAQFDSEITPLQDGGYVVVWTDLSLTYNPQGSAIVGQRYDSAGNKIGGDPAHGGEVHLSLFPNGNQSRPAVTTLANGDIAVAYADLFSGNSDITVHIFDPSLHFVRTDLIEDGLAQTFDPSLTALADGSYVVSYTLGTGTNTEVVARTVSAAGMMGAQFNLEHHPVGSATLPQSFSHLATLSNGNAVAVYTDTFSGARHRHQVHDLQLPPAAGGERGPVRDRGYDQSRGKRGGCRRAARAAASSSSGRSPRTGGTDIRATIMSNDGLPIAFNLLVNTTTPRNQSAADVVALGDGGFLVTWEDVVAGTRGAAVRCARPPDRRRVHVGYRDADRASRRRRARRWPHRVCPRPCLDRLRRDDLDLHRRHAARLQCQRSQRHPVAGRQRHAGALADERLDGGVRQPRRLVQSGAELARQGQRRLQRRRPRPTSCGRTTMARPRSG